MSDSNPEIGLNIIAAGLRTNFHDSGGDGPPLLLIHGSGAGVSAWANWRVTIPALSPQHRVIAPDMVGFGFTERPKEYQYTMENWITHAIAVMDTLGLEKFSLIGNSFGGALALGIAIRYPERVEKLILMGSVGVPFELTEGLDKVWGYTPSLENMKEVMTFFAYNQSLMTDELAEVRYRASIQAGFQESFARMFPAPRQQWIDAMTFSDDEIQSITCPTLITHGREDLVIPAANAHHLFSLIENSQLHLFGKCGHWAQIEHADTFNKLVSSFLKP